MRKSILSILFLLSIFFTEAQPVSSFSVNVTSGNAPLTVNFTDASSGNPTFWAWDFNNDGKTDSKQQNPSYTYSKSGIYSVKLIVSNANSKADKTEDDLIVVLPKITECSFESTPTLVNNFDSHNKSAWMFATWSFGGNASMFKAENGAFNDGKLILKLKKENYNDKSYTGGHYQCHKGYGYGRYEMQMKPAKGGGLVSSFFLYSDYDKKAENGAKWHEIDFEFIHDPLNGNKSTLQFNHWSHDATHGGASGNEVRIVDKRVNKSGLRDKYHKLTIDYTPKYIKWSVDDVPYHIVTENIPVSSTLKIMMNVWRPQNSTHPTKGVNWAGTVNDNDLPVTALYDYVKYYPLVSCDETTVEDFNITDKNTIKQYPNPGKNVLFIESQFNETAFIYNLEGYLLKTIALKKGKNQINISDLPTGVYIIKMNDKKIKFIKS